MRRLVPPALGGLLALIGLVWTLQGANLLGGSFMTGSTLWLVVGLVVLALGIALVIRGLRGRRTPH
jgi:lipopolysaccharide export LptBFGC system permease protein LptF